jgi:hypothetical protein
MLSSASFGQNGLILVVFCSPPKMLSISSTLSVGHIRTTTEQVLDRLIRRPGHELGCLMPREVELDVREPTLGVRVPVHAKVSHVERLGYDRRVEALRARPGHVLDRDARALGDEDVVLRRPDEWVRQCGGERGTHKQAVHDERALRLLDHVREHGERGWDRLVAPDVHVPLGADLPVDVRGVDRLLNLHTRSAPRAELYNCMHTSVRLK